MMHANRAAVEERLPGNNAVRGGVLRSAPGAGGEGVAVMTDDRFAIVGPDHSHNIKSRIPAIKLFAAHKPLRGANQKLLFSPGDGGFGRGEFLAGARADFYKHHVIIV